MSNDGYVRRTATYWRARANEARRLAEQVDDDDRAKMLDVAVICEDLAKQEERLSSLKARRVP